MLGNRNDRVGMRMKIDKSRRDDQAGCVDHARGRGLRAFGGLDYRGDATVLHRYISAPARSAGAVDNRAVANQQIIFHTAKSRRISILGANRPPSR